MQGFIGLLMLAGLIAVLGKMVIGWMLTGLIVSLLLAALFALMAWPSRLERVERIFYAVCALVWLLQALLPQFAIAPRHALFLFLLATAASAAVFLVYSSPSRPWKAIAALAWAVLLAVPFGLLPPPFLRHGVSALLKGPEVLMKENVEPVQPEPVIPQDLLERHAAALQDLFRDLIFGPKRGLNALLVAKDLNTNASQVGRFQRESYLLFAVLD